MENVSDVCNMSVTSAAHKQLRIINEHALSAILWLTLTRYRRYYSHSWPRLHTLSIGGALQADLSSTL